MKKLILGMVLGLAVVSAASTKAEAKTYKVTDSNQGKVEKKVVNLINSKCMEKKNQKFTIKLTSKGKYANWNVTSISDDLAFEYQSSEARFVYPDKSKMKFDIDGIKSGKTKKLGKYVVATYKKSQVRKLKQKSL